MSRGVAKLRGLSPLAIASLALGDRLSLAQVVALKVVNGDGLSFGELTMFRKLTSTRIARPVATGYAECWINKGRRAGGTIHIGAPFVVSALLSPDADALLAPGERGRVLLVAPTLGHLRQLLDAVEGLLVRLRVPHVRREGEIDMSPAGLRTVAIATVADHLGPRGGTALAAVVDEAALLPFDEGADGHDVEVLAAIRPALATTNGKLLVMSSPWAQRGAHYETIRRHIGNPSGRVLVLSAPTWVWHPALSEEKTRELEPDARRWAREYAAIAGEHESSFVDGEDVRACVDAGVSERPPVADRAYVGGIDAGFRNDRFAMVFGHREQRARRAAPPVDLIVVDAIVVLTPTRERRIDFDSAMKTVAEYALRYNNARIYRDAFAGDAIAAALRTRGIRAAECSMSPREQAARFDFLAQKVRAKSLRLVDDDRVVRELTDLRVRMHAAGRIEVAAPNRRGAHDDIADALALMAHAARGLPASGDIRREVRAFHDHEGVTVSQRWYQSRQIAEGVIVELPALPPEGTAARRELDEARHALPFGLALPGDPTWDAPPDGPRQRWCDQRRAWVADEEPAPSLSVRVEHG